MTSFSPCLAPGAQHPPWTNSVPLSPFCFLTELLKTRLCAQQRDKLMRFVKDLLEVLPSPPDTDGAQEASAASLAWIDPLWERRAHCLRWAAAPLHCRQTGARKPDSQSAERYENPHQSRFSGQSAECKFKDEHFSSSLDTDLHHRSSFQSFCRSLKDKIYAF